MKSTCGHHDGGAALKSCAGPSKPIPIPIKIDKVLPQTSVFKKKEVEMSERRKRSKITK